MRSTIELINNTLVEKFKVLDKIINSNDIKHNESTLILKKEFNDIYHEYILNCSCDLINYYTDKENKYYSNIISLDTVNRLDIIINTLHSLNPSSEIQNIASLNIAIPDNATTLGIFETCDCSGTAIQMNIISSESELKCNLCGKTKQLFGSSNDESQFYGQDGVKVKHTTYEARRHYITWMDKIQAKESQSFPQECKEALEKLIKRDKVNITKLTCEMIRKYLKESKLSKYNSRVCYIHKELTGVIPPQLSLDEMQLMSSHYTKVVSLYNTYIKTEKTNSNQLYYPYFIYKIIQHIFKNKPDKLLLLKYIHLQTSITNKKHDKTWKIICDNSGLEYTYEPTDLPLV
jgi:hypothetical protein